MVLESENEANAFLLVMHLRQMAARLRLIPADKWDWTFAPPAPTPRQLGVHALEWLYCDRQHIETPDVSKHRPVPDAPTDCAALCDAMDAEAEAWDKLLRSLTPTDMTQLGNQFGLEDSQMNVRGFVGHMVQNVIYKNGQFATIFFALGLDGDAPYDAPFPNPLYRELAGIG